MKTDTQSPKSVNHISAYLMLFTGVLAIGIQAMGWVVLHKFELSYLIYGSGCLAISLTEMFTKVKSRSQKIGYAIAFLLMLASCILFVLDIRSNLGK